MPATLRKCVTVALARQRRRIRRELDDAQDILHHSNGVLWEGAEQKKRELASIDAIIEEWKNVS